MLCVPTSGRPPSLGLLHGPCNLPPPPHCQDPLVPTPLASQSPEASGVSDTSLPAASGVSPGPSTFSIGSLFIALRPWFPPLPPHSEGGTGPQVGHLIHDCATKKWRNSRNFQSLPSPSLSTSVHRLTLGICVPRTPAPPVVAALIHLPPWSCVLHAPECSFLLPSPCAPSRG